MTIGLVDPALLYFSDTQARNETFHAGFDLVRGAVKSDSDLETPLPHLDSPHHDIGADFERRFAQLRLSPDERHVHAVPQGIALGELLDLDDALQALLFAPIKNVEHLERPMNAHQPFDLIVVLSVPMVAGETADHIVDRRRVDLLDVVSRDAQPDERK